MEAESGRQPPRVAVVVVADVESNARALCDRILTPAGFTVHTDGNEPQKADVLVVDVTQLRGDPLARLRDRRAKGDEAPAIVLAAHFPAARLRELFRLGVGDILIKPYRPAELCQAIQDLTQSHSSEASSQVLARRLLSTRQLLNRRAEELRLLNEIGRSVAGISDLDQILSRVVEAAAFVTEAEEANIYLAEPDTDEVVLRASKQAGERYGTLQRLRVTDTLAGEVYRTGQPVLYQPAQMGGSVKVQTGFLVLSLIKVPIRLRDQIVGVLGVYNRVTPRAFSEHQVTLLMALANWAGVALDRAELMQERNHLAHARADMAVICTELGHRLNLSIDNLTSALEGDTSSLTPALAHRLHLLRTDLQALHRQSASAFGHEIKEGLIDLTRLVRQVASDLKPFAVRQKAELTAGTQSAIPIFRGDQKRARRIVEALTLRALRRSPRGNVSIRTSRFTVQQGRSDFPLIPQGATLEDGHWAAITVSDTGGTLSPEVIQSLSATTADPLTGQESTGMSVGEMRTIAESLGGFLWFEQSASGTFLAFAMPVRQV